MPPQQAKKGGSAKWIVGALLAAGVLIYFNNKPENTQLACDSAFDLGTKAVASGDLGAARAEAVRATAACTDKSRSKAEALQTAISTAQNKENVCQRLLGTVDSDLEDHRLGSAREALNQFTNACGANDTIGPLRKKLGEAQAKAQTAQERVRSALAAKDVERARSALAQLISANRDDPDIAQLKGEIDALVAFADAADSAAAAAATAAGEARRAPEPTAPLITRSAPAESNQRAATAAGFIRDAEAALAQRKFDAAKTYLDSARRVDPSNARIESLGQLIRERERQVLQQETTIR